MVNDREFYDKDYYTVMRSSIGISKEIANRKNIHGYTAILNFLN